MAYDFVFANAQRFETPSETTDNAVTMDAPSAVVTAFADALSNGGRLPLVLADSAVITPNTTFEVVYVTDVDTGAGTLTITRGEEGTTPQTWPAGTVAQNALTSGALNTLKSDVGGWRETVLAANAVMDLSADKDDEEVVIDIPDGLVFFPWTISWLFKDLTLKSGFSDVSPQVNVGSTSGGSEISASATANGIDSTNVGNRVWSYLGDNSTAVSDAIYISTQFSPDGADVLNVQFLIQGTLGPAF